MEKNTIRRFTSEVRSYLDDRVNFKSLKKYVESLEWEVYRYDDSGQQEVGKKMLEMISAEEHAKEVSSFAYNKNNLALIFIKVPNSEAFATHLLAHELGHIMLGHHNDSDWFVEESLQKEQEADYFADVLLGNETAPPQKHSTKKTPLIIGGVVACVIIAVILFLALHNPPQQLPVDNPSPVTQQQLPAPGNRGQTDTQQPATTPNSGAAAPEAANPSTSTNEGNNGAQKANIAPVDDEKRQTVVVTPAGDKYHLPDCQYVKDKEHTLTMTEQEALDQGYGKCKVCFKK